MATSVIIDAGFLVALLSRDDANHPWAAAQAARLPPPWKTCEPAVSEAFHLLGAAGARSLGDLLHRRAAICAFHLGEEIEHVVKLITKYAAMPISFADACLLRMTETMSDPLLLTTDSNFRIYRRHGRKAVPCVLPEPSSRSTDPGRKSDLDDVLQDVGRIFRDEG